MDITLFLHSGGHSSITVILEIPLWLPRAAIVAQVSIPAFCSLALHKQLR